MYKFLPEISVYKFDLKRALNFDVFEDLYKKHKEIVDYDFFGEYFKFINRIPDNISDTYDSLSEEDKYVCVTIKGEYLLYTHKKPSKPRWVEHISNIQGKEKVKLHNLTSSYVVVKIIDTNNIYFLTGGSGSDLIGKICKNNFGIYMLPKLVKDTSEIISKIKDNQIGGKRDTRLLLNRVKTDFNFEKAYNSIYNQIEIEANAQILRLLGVPTRDNPDVKSSILFGRNINIRREMNFDTAMRVIKTIHGRRNKPNKFVISYIDPATKYGFKKAELDDEFSNILNIQGRHDICISYSADNRLVNASEFIIEIDEEEVYKGSTKPSLDNIVDSLRNRSRSSISHMLNKGNIVIGSDTIRIRDCLEGLLVINKNSFVLHQGNWYIMNKSLDKDLKKDFKRISTDSVEIKKYLENTYSVIENRQIKLESDYNKQFKKYKENVLFADVKKMNNVEIGDAFIFEENATYVLHNKMKSSGSDARDLFGQIKTSAEMVRRLIISKDSDKFQAYLQRLIDDNESSFTSDNLLNLLRSRPIVYCANFVKGYAVTSRSTYLQYLTVSTNQYLKDINMKMILL